MIHSTHHPDGLSCKQKGKHLDMPGVYLLDILEVCEWKLHSLYLIIERKLNITEPFKFYIAFKAVVQHSTSIYHLRYYLL